MSYRLNNDWRGNRTYQIGSFPPAFGTMHHSIASYCTEKRLDGLSTEINKKSDLNETLTPESYLTQLQSLSNPLQKNLADTLPNLKVESNQNMTAHYRHSRQKSFDFAVQETKTSVTGGSSAEYSTLSGIGSFISNVFNVISQVIPFQKRPSSTSIANLNEYDATRDSSPPLVTWPKSNLDIQNKNKTQSQTHNHTIEINEEHNTKMNKECLSAASQCEGKLATVRLLLANKAAATKPVPAKPRRPRRVFVPPNSVEQVFVDAFNSEDCEHMSNSNNLEHVSPTKNVTQHFVKLNGPKVNIMTASDVKDVENPAQDIEGEAKLIDCDKDIVNEKCNQGTSLEMTISEVAQPEILLNGEVLNTKVNSNVNLPLRPNNSSDPDILISKPEEPGSLKSEMVASCEEKLNRLKAVLLERKLNNNSKHSTKESIEDTDTDKQHDRNIKHKMHNKKHKDPNRTTDKRQKWYQNKIIKEDMSFANEFNSDSPSSLEISPRPYEVNKQWVRNHTPETATSTPSINGDIGENINKHLTIQDSPVDCIFDEVTGRFRKSSTTESEDSFQIVFTDNLQPTTRSRKLSDCDSEDSFIVFEDSPDSCYTSTDIFGNCDEDSETSSSDCDSDSGNEICKLNHAFSRTVSDLTDASLYEPGGFAEGSACLDSEDEVDSAVKLGEVIKSDLIKDTAVLVKNSADLVKDTAVLVKDSAVLVKNSANLVKTSADLAKDSAVFVKDSAVFAEDSPVFVEDSGALAEDSVALVNGSVDQVEDSSLVVDKEVSPKKTGLLLTDEKKIQKRLEGPRKVRFSDAPPKVHVMRVWQFAAKQARAGHWDRYALDRERFQRRIADVDMAISWVLKPQHRSRVKFQRFMPWWHAQRRKEAEEKKLREEQEKLQKAEEERLRKEEDERMKVEEERLRKEQEERLKEEAERRKEEEKRRKEEEEKMKSEKELSLITNKCLLNVDSINEIKQQISNEVKQLLASSDDELKSSTSDVTKRKLSTIKKDKSLNKKNTTCLNKNGANK